MTKEEIFQKIDKQVAKDAQLACKLVADGMNVDALTEDKVDKILKILEDGYEGPAFDACYSIPEEVLREIISSYCLSFFREDDNEETIRRIIEDNQLEMLFCKLGLVCVQDKDYTFFFSANIINQLQEVWNQPSTTSTKEKQQ